MTDEESPAEEGAAAPLGRVALDDSKHKRRLGHTHTRARLAQQGERAIERLSAIERLRLDCLVPTHRLHNHPVEDVVQRRLAVAAASRAGRLASRPTTPA